MAATGNTRHVTSVGGIRIQGMHVPAGLTYTEPRLLVRDKIESFEWLVQEGGILGGMSVASPGLCASAKV